jgi:hypothetical protein
VLRGDVAESTLVARRFVHVPSLHEGKLGFEDRITQQNDVKTFDSDKVPAGALSVAKCVVEFTDGYVDTPAFDLGPYRKANCLVSSTKQLCWYEGQAEFDGCITVNTDATKAVVGFAEGRQCDLDNVTIRSKCRFGAVCVTAVEKDKDINSSQKLLVVAIARARNTGQKLNAAEDEILEPGTGPVLMESVKAEITIRKAGNPKIVLLDHDGMPTSRILPGADGAFIIDGVRDKTPYYLVRY